MKYIIDIPEDVIQRYKDGLIQLPNIYGMQEILDSIKPLDSFPEREKGTDLISRQKAIDNIKNGFDFETVNGIWATTVLKQVISDLETMPSATPERETLEKIEDEIWNLKEKCTASDYLGCGILDIIEKYREGGKE